MKKYAKLLCMALLSISLSFSLAAAEPSQCENCGQKRMFIVSCGAFSRWKQESAACANNYKCTKRTSLYTTIYTCVDCGWSTISGTHGHMVEHTICEDEFVCPLGDE